MRITFRTVVKGNYKHVIHKFDRELFEALAPKLAKVKIEEFTGSEKGDKVHLKFISPIKAEWKSDIIADEITEDRAYFIDKGVKLPFPLKQWEHHHIVNKVTENSSEIVDVMYFKSYNGLMSILIYPFLYMAFRPRKKIYEKYFGTP